MLTWSKPFVRVRLTEGVQWANHVTTTRPKRWMSFIDLLVPFIIHFCHRVSIKCPGRHTPKRF